MRIIERRVLSLPLAMLMSTLAFSAVSQAEGLTGGVGGIGLTFGHNGVNSDQGNPNYSSRDAFAGIDGTYSFHVAPRLLLGFDASWRADLSDDRDFFTLPGDPDRQIVLGSHVLWELSADSRLGGFLAYGDTRLLNRPSDQNHDYYLVGLEARHFVNDDLMLYAQFAMGDKVRDLQGIGDVGEGFNDGKSVRLGATFFLGDRTALSLDLEKATANPYIDNTDKGEFLGATLSGEMRLGTQAPLLATFYARYENIDATTEGEKLKELSVGFGIKFVFGADTPREAARAGRSIGTPNLPTSASYWTESLD